MICVCKLFVPETKWFHRNESLFNCASKSQWNGVSDGARDDRDCAWASISEFSFSLDRILAISDDGPEVNLFETFFQKRFVSAIISTRQTERRDTPRNRPNLKNRKEYLRFDPMVEKHLNLNGDPIWCDFHIDRIQKKKMVFLVFFCVYFQCVVESISRQWNRNMKTTRENDLHACGLNVNRDEQQIEMKITIRLPRRTMPTNTNFILVLTEWIFLLRSAFRALFLAFFLPMEKHHFRMCIE